MLTADIYLVASCSCRNNAMFSEHVCIVVHLCLKETQHGGEELPLRAETRYTGSTRPMPHPLMTPHVLCQVPRTTDGNNEGEILCNNIITSMKVNHIIM